MEYENLGKKTYKILYFFNKKINHKITSNFEQKNYEK